MKKYFPGRREILRVKNTAELKYRRFTFAENMLTKTIAHKCRSLNVQKSEI